MPKLIFISTLLLLCSLCTPRAWGDEKVSFFGLSCQQVGTYFSNVASSMTTSAEIYKSAPIWFGRDNKAAWPTGDLSDQEVRTVLRRFVYHVIAQLEFEKQGVPITMEELLRELCSRWVSETPYESNSHGLRRFTLAPDGISRALSGGVNDYRRIIRKGHGICGDYQKLVLRLVDLALETRALAHLRPERLRVRELSVIGEGKLGVPMFGANHGAIGLCLKRAFEKKRKSYFRYGRMNHDESAIEASDIVVFDIWERAPVLGTINAEVWAFDYFGFNFKSIIGLAKKEYNIYWGYYRYWSRSV